jgi:two-component system response regulator FixJ
MAEGGARRSPAPTVFVVDDDDAMRASLCWLIGSVDLNVEAYGSAAEFLESYDQRPGCLVLDIRMPGMSGLELQNELKVRAIALPVIFITGHGDVPMALKAVKAGALDFFEKPFSHQELLDRIQEALSADAEARRERADLDRIAARWESLTAREKEVTQLLVGGHANRAIAEKLGISVRTVEVHRAHVMEKMKADSLANLVRAVLRLREAGLA